MPTDLPIDPELFRVLGDPARLRLLTLLRATPAQRTGDLAQQCRLTRQATHHHLAQLRDAGLVTHQRRGRFSTWSPRPEGVVPLLRWGAEWLAEEDV